MDYKLQIQLNTVESYSKTINESYKKAPTDYFKYNPGKKHHNEH